MSTVTFDKINLDRDSLAQFLPDLRSIKAFENLAKVVNDTIPDAVNDNTSQIDELRIDLGSAAEYGAAALMQVAIAMVLANEAAVQTLTAQLGAQRDQIAELTKTINDIKQGTQP